MIKSMTAYGRAVTLSSRGTWVVEVQSVNRRGLDINLSLSSAFLRYDIEIRKLISHLVKRGQVFAKFSFTPKPELVSFDEDKVAQRLAAHKEMWKRMAATVGLNPEEVSLEFLLKQDESLLKEDPSSNKAEEEFVSIEQALSEALKQFDSMRIAEGKALTQDLQERIATLNSHLVQVKNLVPDATERYREKLLKKVQELVESLPENDERVLREVAIYADKVDIAEEITRFSSHLNQFKSFLSGSEAAVGKNLDFLSQELNREVNTMCSKCQEYAIVEIALMMKAEIEKIREQLLNIE